MKKKIVTRRRTPKEIVQAKFGDLEFSQGFALSLILLCQDEVSNSSAQEIIEMRCKEVFEDAGYTYADVMSVWPDSSDLKTLKAIFAV